MPRTDNSCALCTAPTEGGKPWLGLDRVCRRCRSGDMDRAMERWGLALTEERGEADRRRWRIGVRRPTPHDVTARLALEHLSHKARKLFGRRDPEVGDERFDDQIWVEADDGALRLLEGAPGVRATVAALLQVPSVTAVELAAGEVAVELQASTDLADRLVDEVLAKPLEQARHLAVVLAAQVERIAREA